MMYGVNYYADDGCDGEVNVYYGSDLFARRENLEDYIYLGEFESIVDALNAAEKMFPGKSAYLCRG